MKGMSKEAASLDPNVDFPLPDVPYKRKHVEAYEIHQ